MRHLHLQHHDRDQDGDDAVAERFEPGFAHAGRKLDRLGQASNAGGAALLLLGLALGCSKSTSNAPQPPPTGYDNPNNMVEQPLAKPRAEPPPLDNSCVQDADCAPAPACCPAPCTSDVINVKELPKAQDRLAACPKDQQCPSAGGCRTFAYLCAQKKCALVFEGDPGYHQRGTP
ncbi:MAG TPA: hypothetical protein VNG33_10005 [Polyangiaceae bacterium]|nr:hypothetical protein [Polyangiaceae bacterium]